MCVDDDCGPDIENCSINSSGWRIKARLQGGKSLLLLICGMN
jgi:hypothetical protein